jgi:hypothetical protein
MRILTYITPPCIFSFSRLSRLSVRQPPASARRRRYRMQPMSLSMSVREPTNGCTVCRFVTAAPGAGPEGCMVSDHDRYFDILMFVPWLFHAPCHEHKQFAIYQSIFMT